jgi:hypothetical protein
MIKFAKLIQELEKNRKFYLIGFDLKDAPKEAYAKINTEIRETFRDTAKHILDSTWIYSGFKYTAKEIYTAVRVIIKKHVNTKVKIYLLVWKLSTDDYHGTLREPDAIWLKGKLGVS